MNKSIYLTALALLLAGTVQAQEQQTKTTKPMIGSYVQPSGKETIVELGEKPSGPSGWPCEIKFEVKAVDVLNKEEMKISFIIVNTEKETCLINPQELEKTEFYIIDENVYKYRAIEKKPQQVEADWNVHELKGNKLYILGPKERMKAGVYFSVLAGGAREFELRVGYRAQPITGLELIEP